MTHRLLPSAVSFFTLTFISPPASAGSAAASRTPAIPFDPPASSPLSVFERGKFEFSMIAQGYWSFAFENERPTLNYWLGGMRLGYMLTSPHNTGGLWLRNDELLAEILHASVSHGPGDWLAGGNVIYRRNYISRDGRWAWYAELGVGLVDNDIYKDQTQSLIGRDIEISALGGIGVRYQCNAHWSIGLEASYRHFSNANTRERNTGLDSLGGGLSVIYSF